LTNLDQHDIARSSKTFGLDRFYIVTPSEEQRRLADRISGHWREGWGAGYNPDRKSALEIVRVCSTLESAVSDFQSGFLNPVKTVVTGALEREGAIPLSRFRALLQEHDQPFLLLMGTGWGLAKECFTAADYLLKPILGTGFYNHLSVRSAAAIILAQLCGSTD
jgi:hypothetical protein